MEFIDNASELEKYTIVHTSRFPKRFTFTLANEIVGYSREVYNYVSSANRYPTTIRDYNRRFEMFSLAKEELEKMVRQLRMADDIFGIKANTLRDWMWLIEREERLINGVIISDKQMVKFLKSEESKKTSKKVT